MLIICLEEISGQCKNTQTSVLVGVNLLALKMLRVAGQIASIRRMILVGEYTNGFVSMEDMLRDRSDLFSEHIHVIQMIPTPAKFK